MGEAGTSKLRQESYHVGRMDAEALNQVLRRLAVRLDRIEKELDNLKRTKADR